MTRRPTNRCLNGVLDARTTRQAAVAEGCVRIPATLNDLIDRLGVLDEDYERTVTNGSRLCVPRKDRTPIESPGRYLVVVDSNRGERPAWSPLPSKR